MARALGVRPEHAVEPDAWAQDEVLPVQLVAVVEAHALTGEGRYRDAAEKALATAATLAEKAPRFAGWSLAAAGKRPEPAAE